MGDAQAGQMLAVDVGNTETHLGLFRAGELLARRSLTTRRLTSDEVVMQVRAALGRLGPDADGGLGGAILSCVVPPLTDAWRRGLDELSETRPLVVGPGLKTGMRMRYNDPSEVGPDRVADVVAARDSYGGSGAPVVVVDLGTTTNLEVVDGQGAFLGGIIAPGLRMGAEALSRAAARLPMVELRAPRNVIGKSTQAAMQSGVMLGEAARIDGLLDAVTAELGEAAVVVLTGDDANGVAGLLRHEATVDGTLTLRGLYLLWSRNQR